MQLSEKTTIYFMRVQNQTDTIKTIETNEKRE